MLFCVQLTGQNARPSKVKYLARKSDSIFEGVLSRITEKKGNSLEKCEIVTSIFSKIIICVLKFYKIVILA